MIQLIELKTCTHNHVLYKIIITMTFITIAFNYTRLATVIETQAREQWTSIRKLGRQLQL